MSATSLQTPGGYPLWHVEQNNLPIVNISFAFDGGISEDGDQHGAMNVLARMMTQGAGDFASDALQQRLDDLSISLSFRVDDDALTGQLRYLKVYEKEALELFKTVLLSPRFDDSDFKRVVGQVSAGLQRAYGNQDFRLARMFSELAYLGHPYGAPSQGTLTSLRGLTPADLRARHQRLFAQDGLHVVIVGNVDQAGALSILSQTFDLLPQHGERRLTPRVVMQNMGQTYVEMRDGPQSSVYIGLAGPTWSDPDYIPSVIMGHILGGGSLNSQLYKAVREDKGLAYSVNFGLSPLHHAGQFIGAVQTQNDRVQESLDIFLSVLRNMAENGPRLEDLKRAQDYLVGSFPLRFDSSMKIASQLLAYQLVDLPVTYLEDREQIIRQVSLEDVRDAAKRYLAQRPLIVIVGSPKDIEGVPYQAQFD